ncbi:MAG: autotransporter outer membrane beta-barrel domain-containing protein [Verrucomicrobiales bacterium]|jgi:outer membrane autotransporter protein|nr:autotransporter outer membrane beta-barrel domain-containing protein [Verrucomicrobiales bacterium]
MHPKLTLLTLCALSVGFAAKRRGIRASVYLLAYFTALNVFADVKYVTPGEDVTETDQTYAAVTGSNALRVTSGTYHGTDLTLSSTVNTHAAYVTSQGSLTLTGGTVSVINDSYDSGLSGVYAGGTSTATLEQVSIVVSGSHDAIGIRAVNSAIVAVNGGSIITSGTGGEWGQRALNAGGNDGYNSSGQIIAENLLITVQGRGFGTIGEGFDGMVKLKQVTILSEWSGLNAQWGGTIIADQVTIEAAVPTSSHLGGTLILNDSLVISTGTRPVLSVANDNDLAYDATLVVTGGTLVSDVGLLLIGGTQTGHAYVTLNNVDTTDVTGGINSTTTTAATVDINGGPGVNGDLTNSASGTLTVNFNHSTVTGDVINAGDGVLVVTLDNNSIGTGGYHGGDLITGGDSIWTFNKNSHGNYGENNGTWNIGDYEVIFDNLTNTGTVTISVNSDTGAGGSIIVTDTADGEGKVHIDTTGNGQLNPNDVLPGVVSGDGTEHWQWDPIDWGIDTVIKDGDHFIKKGTSPAGAVLNSSVAIQQAMWFAQQNSLLKRMGELHYGARASRPLADKDVRAPYNSLIENIWLRSYGQQLNVGSQVAGKAYEQLIYGIDLGTDHKFTISADSDLYLGMYAGYGRSDIDYRTPGADGELNSYYGGLYATWLHSSGFYLDATFKAASVNNDLKAPYGTTQLTANYSDVNLGGSLEIGKKFTFSDAWFIEPQFQVNYLHILAEDYTAGPLTISAQDLDALQFRIGSVFGRTIKLTNGGALQPYVKISGVETISSGGTIRNGYQSTRANTDGARAELGGGLIWQLDTNNQLHLDYEASFGDKYDKPWGLTAGYRHQF